MWAATRSAWTVLFERQLQYDSRSFLWDNLRRSSSRKAAFPISRNPRNPDILLMQDPLPERGQPVDDQLVVKSRALAETLDCDEQAVTEILKFYPEVVRKPLGRLIWTARILKMRYPVESILTYPSVLNLSWRAVESRRQIFEEIKARNKQEIEALVLFEETMGQTIFELTRRNVISNKDLLPSVLSKIENCPPGLEKELTLELTHPACMAFTLREYRRFIIKAYLYNRLGKFTIRNSTLTSLENQSMDLISVRMNILLTELRLDPQFLISQWELLIVNTYNLQDILTRCVHLNDVPLKEIVNGNPKVLGMSVQRLCNVERILRSQSISPAFVTNYPNIFNIHPDAFKFSDENGTANDGELPMRWLHFRDIADRMGKIARESRARIKLEPSDEKGAWRSPLISVMDYLTARLEADASQKARIRKAMIGNPLKKYSNLAQTAEVCDFLLNEGIMTKEQILGDVSICWWDAKTIRKAVEIFPRDAYEEALGPRWRDHPFLAEMLVYEMENLGVSILPSWRVEDESEEDTLDFVDYEGDDADGFSDQFEEPSTDLGMIAEDQT